MWQRLVHAIVILVAVLAVVAILYVGANAMGITIPPFLVQIATILVVAGIVIGAIYLVVDMVRRWPGPPST